ncbi:methyltransferase domain-containing protein [bacterium]|nr:methyltransferase domain-containing protein [bacterium]
MSTILEKLYNEKNISYYSSSIREDIISLILGKELNILEVGCGNGATLIELKRNGIAKEIIGIELYENALSNSKHLLDRIIIGNIEDIELDFDEHYFDVIIFADVLEHLLDPYTIIKKIKKYLKPSGIVISSIPNIQECMTLLSIFKGDFKYVDSGILDKTHLRFFCKKNMIKLFDNDFIIRKIQIKNQNGSKRAIVNKLTFRIFEHFLATQYIIVAEYVVVK